MSGSIESKFLGGMVGHALGDAIGELAFYCRNREELLGEINRHTTLTYTDDTAMAIGLAECLIENQGTLEAEKLGGVFHRNFSREPWRGYASGPPTIFAIVQRTGASYVEVAQSMFGGQGSFGNGSAMRITPLGHFFHNSTILYEIARTSAIVTHSHVLGVEGAAVLARAVGFAVDKYPSGIDTEVLVSGDRDTIGAMVGGLLGSYLGIDAIPNIWLDKLENCDYILELGREMLKIKMRL